ncbi:TlpA disulfide reductase family protein [Saprospira sp. CCB-QB6]|uniref:peroxiredoxin family protein n=1 Tax=Saprospira sp. CCB-QB6 TaxID=3023936 RepID=UPI00234B196A|nr:TlpA disulfide reductase family protein [Saprospira sp. CCB-QB6]WCL81913.1 TlpA disulfide reductase family protein [Saprospira sp. CCB-QB6]
MRLLIFSLLLLGLACGTKKPLAESNPEQGEVDYLQYLENQKKAILGQKAPNFQLKDLDGKSVQLSDYAGQVVLVNFFFKNCKPCQVEVPSLNQLQEDFGPEGLVVLGLSRDDLTTTQAFAQEFKSKSPLLYNAQEVAKTYKVVAYPSNILIDKNGKIIEYFTGSSSFDATYTYRELKPAIRKALKQ